jgi:hypothetical protein
MDKPKIVEIVVTDERGVEHTLRCADGLDVTFSEDDKTIWVVTMPPAKRRSLSIASGRWISFRLTYAD